MDGKNNTLFCYGQTGSGKTYTMTGSLSQQFPSKKKVENKKTRNFFILNQLLKSQNFNFSPKAKITDKKEDGILILSLKEIFLCAEETMEKEYEIECSYLEIYNDQVYDLLQDSFENPK